MAVGARYFRHTPVNCTRPEEAEHGLPYGSVLKLAALAVGLLVALLHIALLARQCRRVQRSIVFYTLCMSVLTVCGVCAVLPIVLEELSTQFHLVKLHTALGALLPYSFGLSCSYNVAVTYTLLLVATEATLAQCTRNEPRCNWASCVHTAATRCTQGIDKHFWCRYVAMAAVLGLSAFLCSFVFSEVVVMYNEECVNTLTYYHMLNDLMQRSDFMHFMADAYAPIAWYIPLCVTVVLFLPHLLHWCNKKIYWRCIKRNRLESIAKDEYHASRLLTEAMTALAIQTLLTVMPENAAAWALNMPAHAVTDKSEELHMLLEVFDHMFHLAHAMRIVIFLLAAWYSRRRNSRREDAANAGDMAEMHPMQSSSQK